MENNIPDKTDLMRAGGPVLTSNFIWSAKDIFDWIKEEYRYLMSSEKILTFLWYWGTLTKQMTGQSILTLASLSLGSGVDAWLYFSATEVGRQPDLSSTPPLQILISFSAARRRAEEGGSTYHFPRYKQKGHYRIFFTEAPSTERQLEQLCSQLPQKVRPQLLPFSPPCCFFWYCAVLFSFDLSFSTLPSWGAFILCFSCPVTPSPAHASLSLRSCSLPSSHTSFLSQFSLSLFFRLVCCRDKSHELIFPKIDQPSFWISSLTTFPAIPCPPWPAAQCFCAPCCPLFPAFPSAQPAPALSRPFNRSSLIFGAAGTSPCPSSRSVLCLLSSLHDLLPQLITCALLPFCYCFKALQIFLICLSYCSKTLSDTENLLQPESNCDF